MDSASPPTEAASGLEDEQPKKPLVTTADKVRSLQKSLSEVG